jgi:hypothetical protein
VLSPAADTVLKINSLAKESKQFKICRLQLPKIVGQCYYEAEISWEVSKLEI